MGLFKKSIRGEVREHLRLGRRHWQANRIAHSFLEYVTVLKLKEDHPEAVVEYLELEPEFIQYSRAKIERLSKLAADYQEVDDLSPNRGTFLGERDEMIRQQGLITSVLEELDALQDHERSPSKPRLNMKRVTLLGELALDMTTHG